MAKATSLQPASRSAPIRLKASSPMSSRKSARTPVNGATKKPSMLSMPLAPSSMPITVAPSRTTTLPVVSASRRTWPVLWPVFSPDWRASITPTAIAGASIRARTAGM